MTVYGLKRDTSAGLDGLDRVFGPANWPICCRSATSSFSSPATAETRGMIGAPQLACMKPGAI
jgi:phosphoglycerate dehydrogenase-like enzyme